MSGVQNFIEACCSPIGIVTLLLTSGLFMGIFRRQSRTGRFLISGGAGLFLVFLFTPLAEVTYSNLEHAYPPMLRADASVTNVVVLGGYGEDMPFLPVTSQLSVETIARMVEGIRLYRQLPSARLILSGGTLRPQDVALAKLMADFANVLGVPERDIVMEALSTTTYENLHEVKNILGTESFILVTSSGALWRAAAVARKLGMRPLPAPADIWASRYYRAGMTRRELAWKFVEDIGYPSTDRLVYLQRAHHEYLGYLWYWMHGRV